MRRSLLLGATALALAGAAHAVTPNQNTAVRSGQPQFVPTAPVSIGAVKFPDDNGFGTSTTVNDLTFPSGAMDLPSGGSMLSWAVVEHFRYDDSVVFQIGGPNTYLLAKCAAACSTGNDRAIWITNPAAVNSISTQNSEINSSGYYSGVGNFFISPISGSRTAINLTRGSSYCLVEDNLGTDASPALSTAGIMAISVLDANGNLVGQSVSTSSDFLGNHFFTSADNVQRAQSTLGELYNTVGGMNATTTPTRGLGGSAGPVAMLWGPIAYSGAGRPTLAALQRLCSPNLQANAVADGFKIRFLAGLNDAFTATHPAYYTDPSTTPSLAGLTINETGTVQAGAPIMPSPALTLVSPGAGYVHAATLGQTGSNATGNFWVKGNYSVAALGNAPRGGVDIAITNATTGAILYPWSTIPASNGSFYAAYPGVKVGGPYGVMVRVHNARSYTYTDNTPQYMGFSAWVYGQSEEGIMFTPCNQGGTTCTGAQLTYGTENVLTYADTPFLNSPFNTGAYAHAFVRQLSTVSQAGNASTSIIGDGALRIMKDLAVDSADSGLPNGWPIMVVNLTKNGQPAGAFAYDGMIANDTLNIGACASTCVYSKTPVSLANASPPLIAGVTTYTLTQSIVPGTLKVYDGTGALVGSADNSGNITGASISTGSVNNLTRAVSVTFASAPVAPIKVTWQHVMDVANGSGTQANPYNGYGAWGDSVNSSSGMVTATLNRMVGPPSLIFFEQCNANASEFASAVGGATITSWTNQWNFVWNNKLPAFQAWKPGIPILVGGYPRDTGGSFASANGCQDALQRYAAGNGYTFAGTYTDLDVDQIASPHENPNIIGGQRKGARVEKFWWGAQKASVPVQPYISAVSGKGANTLTFTVTLSGAATSLATCGASLATSLICASTPSGTVLGFRIGASATAMYDQDGHDAYNLVSDPTQAFACSIATATTIQCVKTSGVFSATPYYSFDAGMGVDKWGTLLSITQPTVSGCPSDGTFVVPMTGGTAVNQPSIKYVVSGGAITSAGIYSTGHGITVNPTVAYPTGCGAPTTPLTPTFGTHADDQNALGLMPYDNNGPMNGQAPGYPLTPVVQPQLVVN